MLNLKKLLTKLCAKIGAIGTVYSAPWVATESSASGTILARDLTLPAGTYLFIVNVPTASANITVSLAGHYITLTSLGSAVIAYTLSSAGGLALRSAQSAEVTFSYIERGSLTAIRIA